MKYANFLRWALSGLIATWVYGIPALAQQPATGQGPLEPAGDEAPSAERGYHLLTRKAYIPPDFDQETFDQVWRVWPYTLREQARKATPQERRAMAFNRYGLTERPAFNQHTPDGTGQPLQYVVDAEGGWAINCFSCHGGQVNGQIIPGLPNANFEMHTLVEEIRLTKLLLGKRLVAMDTGSLFFPLGTSRGLTNAVMFGVAVMNTRDKDLNLMANPPIRFDHHDMDPPAMWNLRKRNRIYIDGFAEKSVRSLMQFMLMPKNGPEKFRAWESDFRSVFAYFESIPVPKYPFPIDQDLARQGKVAFEANCSRCHGTYAENPDAETYPHRVVPIDEIATDPVRWKSLHGVRHRYGESWFAHYGKEDTVLEPAGYLAPPLDGIWASAPYFHNGAVPTLEEVLHPDHRPSVWRHTEKGYDVQRVGLTVDRLEHAPDPAKLSRRARRQIYDSSAHGKSHAGHTYPDALSDEEKQAVLEYLKTL